MWGRKLFPFCFLAFLPLQLASARQRTSPWKTLNGKSPAIVAKGGFSGLFPDSSEFAYTFISSASSPDTILWCDLRLTKDGLGLCLPDIVMDNCTDVADYYPTGQSTYVVNGVSTRGWFSVDYNGTELENVCLVQSIFTRMQRFDKVFPIYTVQDVASKYKPAALWLNVQNDIFYTQHNLNMRSYILSVTKRVRISYISSPEVKFLSSISGKVGKTTLIFRFLDADIVEPSTNRTYDSLLKNLTFIRTFASGILVPKTYIWPVTSDNYLQSYTSVVTDAHNAGLEIYAGDFANDQFISYNYSYDPLAEYLSYIDNGHFSVDGFVTDFPVTASAATGCYSFLNNSVTNHGKPLIISHNGASGDYPDCTDLAYEKAVNDGADVIDCAVQITEDKIPICMSSINLIETTTVLKSAFNSRLSTIAAIQSTEGIFTFNLTWDEIAKNLKPQISAPLSISGFQRNPRYKNAGNFMRLSDFLSFAKEKDLSGISLSVEYAGFMAQSLGVDIVETVITALDTSGYNKQTTQEVMIQSTDSSVLTKFRQLTKYKLVYMITEDISDADPASLGLMKKFADAVAVHTLSILPEDHHFTTKATNLVQDLQSSGLAVYAYVLMNEYFSQPYDFFSDASIQIQTYAQGAGVDGIITDFPGTARRYKRNHCIAMGNNAPVYMNPAAPGGLMNLLISSGVEPPALSPASILRESDVVEPPLPSAISSTPLPSPTSSTPIPSPGRSEGGRTCASMAIPLAMLMLMFARVI